ncbi:MAG: VTT domain-containing protein [Polycyclovorans sp.]|nr:VTT domain-containing protein [Polycyclovorans sp.]
MIPTDLASLLDLIRHHGEAAYGFMFAYATAHMLLVAIFAGYVAHGGAFELGPLIGVCWAGSFAGDVVRFWVGRRFGTRWLGRWPRVERAVQLVARLADRHYAWMVLVHRYPYGIRGIAGFAYGASSLPWPRFLALNFVAAGVWSVATVGSGYAFGFVSEKTLSNASSGLGVGLLLVFLVLAWALSRRLERAIERG